MMEKEARTNLVGDDLDARNRNWDKIDDKHTEVDDHLAEAVTDASGVHGLIYEEGEWTPTVIGVPTAGTATYTVRQGNYIRIGNIVIFNSYFSWSGHTGTGSMQIAGLPFAPTIYTGAIIGEASNIALSGNNTTNAYVNTSNSRIVLTQTPLGGGASASIVVDSAGSLMLSGTYITAQ